MRRRKVLSNSSPLVEAVVGGKWEKVVEISKDNPDLLSARVTVSGETALHMAISAGRTEIVRELVELIRNNAEQARKALMAVNERGNTPLHLAAAIGNFEMFRCIEDVDACLIACRNRDGETPLFLAVLHGIEERRNRALLYLVSRLEERLDQSLYQRKDCYTILHFAILRDCFVLARCIIRTYPDLVNAFSADGISPLHILATKPSAFPSGTTLMVRVRDWIIHRGSYEAVDLLDELLERTSMYKNPDDDGSQLFDDDVENQGHEENYETTVESSLDRKPKPLLIAAKNGITKMVERYLERFPMAVFETDEEMKNIVLLAVEHRQPQVYELVLNLKTAKDTLFRQVDKDDNSVLHLAAKLGDKYRTQLNQDAALHMQREIKWFQYVRKSMPVGYSVQHNTEGETAEEVFRATHKDLVKVSGEWFVHVSQSCSLVATLVATVAFATATTIPGSVKQDIGTPTLEKEPAFYVFAIASLVAMCFSVTSTVLFLAILTSGFQIKDFRTSLPMKLLMGLATLCISITAMMVSFCASHFFILKDKMSYGAFWLYAAMALMPVIMTFLLIARFPHSIDLMWATFSDRPLAIPPPECIDQNDSSGTIKLVTIKLVIKAFDCYFFIYDNIYKMCPSIL